MTITANLAARLGQVIGTHRVASAPEELAAHAADGILPQAIAGPATADEVSEIVRLALAEKLAIQAFGSRSKCEMGMPPERCDIALDMTHLREVAHYDAGDLTLSVDAGMPLRELADFLSGYGQFLPLAVPCFENTTVGGAVASGMDSALRQQYGSARDFLIGAEFVDGTGRLCKSGGRVVKNVTGYDLHKLLIGSLGTLGVITRLNFRTFPLPAASGACLAMFRNSRDALVFRKAIERKGLPLADLEILSPGTSEILRAILERTDAHVAGLLRSGAWCAYGSYEGNQPVVARITGELQQAAKDADAPECTSLEKSADEQLGGMLREAYEWLRWASRAAVVQRVVLPQVTESVLADLEGMAACASLRSSLLLRAGGVLYVSLFADSENHTAMVSLGNVAQSVTEVVRNNRGHSTMLHAPVPVKTHLAAARITLPDHALQLRLKQAFDPSNIFAPGRIVGGI
jgi:glycolate oxidase FAD binding subunit